MNAYFERIRDEHISLGKAQGFALGKEQGIALGKEQGKAQGFALGEAQGIKCGSFDRLINMTKRIMTRMGKSLEDAMTYLQLDDGEKQQVRDAMQTA